MSNYPQAKEWIAFLRHFVIKSWVLGMRSTATSYDSTPKAAPSKAHDTSKSTRTFWNWKFRISIKSSCSIRKKMIRFKYRIIVINVRLAHRHSSKKDWALCRKINWSSSSRLEISMRRRLRVRIYKSMYNIYRTRKLGGGELICSIRSCSTKTSWPPWKRRASDWSSATD